jgi:steroid 5-alpha reductase family enzyme
MRAYWGEKADLYFLPFFVGQCVLVPLFVMPLLPAFADTRAGWRATDVLGALLWIAALAGETLTDRQLARFRADPVNRGRTCRLGLWRYSRHPNYFCEWLHWWSYVLVGATAAGGWLTLVGPAAMYAFLMWLTGIPHTEKQALSKRGDDYRDYQRTTNMFFPWFPKRSGHADAAD